ncbi:MAG: inositol monophosphatase [Proteobacteria bacterium]|nr:inositol monophosphatase [Pseudomonadota bacterium]
MLLSHKDLQTLADIAISAACQAGDILIQYAQQEVIVQHKIGGENLASQVLTKVDILCQEVILKILQSSCKDFDLALLSEESEDDQSRLEKDYFWSIDPLDGTLPFIESTSGYAVSIALVSRSGSAVIGVIFDPIEKTLYHAIRGCGAFRNKQAWSIEVSSITNHPLTIVSDRSFLKYPYYEAVISELKHFAHERGLDGLKTIQHGGAAMNACWVLENSPACYFKFPKTQNGGGSLWDYAASSCIFNEIGAYVNDIHGQALELNRADTCFMNQQGVLFTTHKNIEKKIQEIYKKSLI